MEDAQIFLMLLPEKAAQHDLVSCGESELFMSNDSALALEQPEATKVKLPDFPICSRSLSIPGKIRICSDFCWSLHGSRWQNTATGFPHLIPCVSFRVAEVFQDTKRLPPAGAKGFFAQQSPVLPARDWVSVQFHAPSEVGALLFVAAELLP